MDSPAKSDPPPRALGRTPKQARSASRGSVAPQDSRTPLPDRGGSYPNLHGNTAPGSLERNESNRENARPPTTRPRLPPLAPSRPPAKTTPSTAAAAGVATTSAEEPVASEKRARPLPSFVRAIEAVVRRPVVDPGIGVLLSGVPDCLGGSRAIAKLYELESDHHGVDNLSTYFYMDATGLCHVLRIPFVEVVELALSGSATSGPYVITDTALQATAKKHLGHGTAAAGARPSPAPAARGDSGSKAKASHAPKDPASGAAEDRGALSQRPLRSTGGRSTPSSDTPHSLTLHSSFADSQALARTMPPRGTPTIQAPQPLVDLIPYAPETTPAPTEATVGVRDFKAYFQLLAEVLGKLETAALGSPRQGDPTDLPPTSRSSTSMLTATCQAMMMEGLVHFSPLDSTVDQESTLPRTVPPPRGDSRRPPPQGWRATPPLEPLSMSNPQEPSEEEKADERVQQRKRVAALRHMAPRSQTLSSRTSSPESSSVLPFATGGALSLNTAEHLSPTASGNPPNRAGVWATGTASTTSSPAKQRALSRSSSALSAVEQMLRTAPATAPSESNTTITAAAAATPQARPPSESAVGPHSAVTLSSCPRLAPVPPLDPAPQSSSSAVLDNAPSAPLVHMMLNASGSGGSPFMARLGRSSPHAGGGGGTSPRGLSSPEPAGGVHSSGWEARETTAAPTSAWRTPPPPLQRQHLLESMAAESSLTNRVGRDEGWTVPHVNSRMHASSGAPPTTHASHIFFNTAGESNTSSTPSHALRGSSGSKVLSQMNLLTRPSGFFGISTSSSANAGPGGASGGSFAYRTAAAAAADLRRSTMGSLNPRESQLLLLFPTAEDGAQPVPILPSPWNSVTDGAGRPPRAPASPSREATLSLTSASPLSSAPVDPTARAIFAPPDKTEAFSPHPPLNAPVAWQVRPSMRSVGPILGSSLTRSPPPRDAAKGSSRDVDREQIAGADMGGSVGGGGLLPPSFRDRGMISPKLTELRPSPQEDSHSSYSSALGSAAPGGTTASVTRAGGSVGGFGSSLQAEILRRQQLE